MVPAPQLASPSGVLHEFAVLILDQTAVGDRPVLLKGMCRFGHFAVFKLCSRLSTQWVVGAITTVELVKQSFEVVQAPCHGSFKLSADKHTFMLVKKYDI